MEFGEHEIKPVSKPGLSAGWRFLIVFQFFAIIALSAAVIWQISKGPVVIRERVSGRAAPASFETPKKQSAAVNQSYQSPSDVFWIADLAEKSLPFVVNIKSEAIPEEKPESAQKRQGGAPSSPFSPNSPGFKIPEEFKEFFPDMQFPEGFDQWHNFDVPRQGEGSGFIVSEDGYIVTNAHVVADFNKFTVTLNDGKQYEGVLKGTDDLKDIAVIKIEAGGLPAATLGDSDTIRPGEPAIAIGSPFGLQHTVTSGIVSAVDRKPADVNMPEDPRSNGTLIQTDAAINRGNSGGPLLNARGEVIGVNQAIIPMGERIGFAIPVNSIKRSIQQIIETGSVKYPGIGIRIRDVDKTVQEELKLEIDFGIVIYEVTQGSAGDKAGLKVGDVITHINGMEVKTGNELINEIQNHNIGDKITLTVYPQGKKPAKNVLVLLGELNSTDAAPWRR
ncbi:MAG: trypsin-like peptidase domain-containing protein [bacterium]|jgi:S1-C subfamily serine protease